MISSALIKARKNGIDQAIINKLLEVNSDKVYRGLAQYAYLTQTQMSILLSAYPKEVGGVLSYHRHLLSGIGSIGY